MSKERDMRSIYLYKPPKTANLTNTWVYYRIDSVDGPDEPAGTLNAPIQMCRVSWPSFIDIPPVTDTPGITGLASAYEHMCRLAKSQWGVEHDKDGLIGFLEYEIEARGGVRTVNDDESGAE